MKTCTSCFAVRPLMDYYKNSHTRDLLTHECKICLKGRHKEYRRINKSKIAQKQKEWDKANPERIKGIQLRRHYWPHLTAKEAFNKYCELYNDQKGCCAICGELELNILDGLHVDHNHLSKKIRGLLCENCNLALGKLKDNINSLEKAITYVKNDGSIK